MVLVASPFRPSPAMCCLPFVACLWCTPPTFMPYRLLASYSVVLLQGLSVLCCQHGPLFCPTLGCYGCVPAVADSAAPCCPSLLLQDRSCLPCLLLCPSWACWT